MKYLLSLLVALLITAPAFGNELRTFQDSLQSLDNLRDSGVLTAEQHAELESTILGKAALAADQESITREELDKLTTTFSDQVLNFFTFLNIIWVTAALLGIVAVCWLFGLYFVVIAMQIPVRAWESLIYVACFACIASDLYFGLGLLLAFPGCVGLYPAAWFSFLTRTGDTSENPLKGISWHSKEKFPAEIVWTLLTIVWGAVALITASHLIGFLAVIGFMATTGCIAGHSPGMIFIGFEKDDKIVQGTFAAFLCLIAYLFFGSHQKITPFDEGWAFLGTMFYFLGLLILGNKWYCSESCNWRDGVKTNWPQYIAMQVIMVASGGLALYLGTIYDLSLLLGVGGTFFYIYMLEKYYELPWEGKGWAWSLLGLSGILYTFVLIAQKFPQYFLFG